MIRTLFLAAIPAGLLVAFTDSAQGHNGTLMAESFAPFKPSVRFYWDSNSFYVESDSMPNATLMPNPMVGITSWQQQLPITLGYFGNITNSEPDPASLGYGQPNVWKIPMVPVAAASPISLTGNFLRGAIAVAANGIAIFNPRNNTGQFSQAIGELDQYGGHCGKADDYHYHIAPTHLTAVLGNSKPVAWALDGYPIYGYLEPDGSTQLALDTDGGHDHGSWGYHYHARGTAATGPQSPYLMSAMHGTVVNYGGQIDPQPTVGSIAPAGSPLAGAVITGFSRPAKGQYALTYTVSGTTYNVAWQEDRIAHTVAVQREAPSGTTVGTTTGTYTSAARFNYYPMAGPSMLKLPDTGQTLVATSTFGQDSDYTRNPPSYTDNGNGTITDNVTGLIWQKVDSGEMTWENAIAGAAGLAVGGYTDWRLPTAQEAFCILNHDRNPALDSTYFVNNVGGTPAYFWTSDLFYGDNTKAWATNTGGGVGPHPKTSTISAGGSLRFHARYVRGAPPTVGHNYFNNLNGTVTDTDTGLMWAQVPSSAMTWANALNYAEGLSLGGYSDWRLPNVKELQSLVDLPRAIASSSTTAPCINRTLFSAATATAHWTSTSVKAGTATQAWLVDFGVTTSSTPTRNQQGIVSYEPYTSTYPAFAVRTAAEGVAIASPTISAIAATPAAPTNLDSPWINATIQAGSGATIASAQLIYNGGLPTTSTVFTETMAATAANPWTGAGAINSWTITNTGGGAGNIKQTATANHGSGNAYGLEMSKGSATAAQTMVATTNVINATGATGYIEFWIGTQDMASPNGWNFQTSIDGTTWNTRVSELTGSNHTFQQYHYDLIASELVGTLKLRFQFAGSSTATPPPKVSIDDITVVTTSGSAAVTLTMLDDGLHNDGNAGDGVYGVQIPAKTSGTTVSYTIAATDNNSSVTTSSAGSYTVVTASPVLAVTPATGFSSSGASGGGTFLPLSANYTLTNNGTGTMSWTASKTAGWLSLSNSSGTLAAGASTMITASINTANANSLTVATYDDVITFTNGSNGMGNTTRAVSLLVTAGVPTAPVAPSVAALPAYSAGTSKSLSWPTVSTATGYTIQVATDSAFTSNVVTQTVTNPAAAFSDLANGVTYFYRVLASNSIGSSSYSSYVSSTQDAVAPAVAIASPTSGASTTSNTVTVTGSSSDGLSGISGVKVNNVVATSSNGFATWSATVPLCFGTNGITATATDGAGNLATSPAILVTDTTWQTYNPLYIPDVITGTTFNLTLSQKSKQFPYLGTTLQTNTTAPSSLGTATTTLGYNGALMWGPTLIMNQGDAVQLNVTNNVPIDTTTVHWHGFHIPAIMDGGPHQVIPSGTTWSPTFTVKNNAATYWYHPHLHIATQKQLTMGAGGFIIVRDPQETALALPRTYGVDDIPLALTSRRFVAPNEFGSNQYTQSDGTTSTLDNYGDFVLVNGTPTNVSISGTGPGAVATLYPPQVSLPKQYVRLRILNAEIQRGYNLGFSDNRTFYVIANDQGLMNAPVPVTRMFLMVGERVEILVNLGSDSVGSSFDLKAYNSGQVFGFPGQEGTPKLPNGASGGENGSLLNNTDFSLLHINVAASTANPITSLPSTLANNTYWTNANVTNTRTIAITGGNGSTPGFKFDNIGYTPTLFNHTIDLNAVEKWTVSAGNVFGHSLHIHDIKFNILTRTGGTQVTSTGLAAPYESGWKDTVYIPKGETVSVIAKYDDFASNTNPFMFHCHFLNHEDGGMMGQFVVVNHAVEDLAIASFTRDGANREINLQFKSTVGTTYTLQYSADMTTGSWVDIGSVTSDGASANFTETDAARLSQARGFYRVTIPSIP